MTRNYVKGDKVEAHFYTFSGKNVHGLVSSFGFPGGPFSLSRETPKLLLLIYVKCTDLECRQSASIHVVVRQNEQHASASILKLQGPAARRSSSSTCLKLHYFGNS